MDCCKEVVMAQVLESSMIKEMLESRWQQIKAVIRERFGNLTEEDIKTIDGHYDTLIQKLEQRYGYSKAFAAEEFQKWVMQRYPNFLSGDKTYVKPVRVEEPLSVRKEDSFSPLKWLLYAGLPLLIIGGLLGYQIGKVNEAAIMHPGVVNESTLTRVVTPADQTLINGIRQALMGDRLVVSDLGNVQITSSNGVVTLSGTVQTAQHRDAIVNDVQHVAGVKQINNLLEVRSF